MKKTSFNVEQCAEDIFNNLIDGADVDKQLNVMLANYEPSLQEEIKEAFYEIYDDKKTKYFGKNNTQIKGGKMNINLTKTQWEQIGKTAGWIKKEANIAMGKTEAGQKVALLLNNSRELNSLMPNNATKARSLASDLVRLIDEDFNQQNQIQNQTVQ